ncbi:Ca2+/H+ antiporter [Bradyrhizobium sp. USDA 4448]
MHRSYAGTIKARRKRTGHFWQGHFGAVAMDEHRSGTARFLWMLVFVPVVIGVAHIKPDARTLLCVLAVITIVPLASLLSHTMEAVAERTGDAVGGLLNAMLGNLTELIIAITALRAGQFMLVKASIAGAIVTNALFMLGALLLPSPDVGSMQRRVSVEPVPFGPRRCR